MNSIKNFGMKFALILVALFSVSYAKAQNEATLEIPNTAINSYEPFSISVNLNTSSPAWVAGLQFRVILPEGLEYADGEDTELTLSDRFGKHRAALNPANGLVLITGEEVIKETEGELLSIPVKVKQGVLATGETLQIQITNIVFSSLKGDIEVKQSNFTTNVMLEPFSFKGYLTPDPIQRWGEKTSVSFCLDNVINGSDDAAPVASLQFTMTLPEGLTVDESSIKINSERMFSRAEVGYNPNTGIFTVVDYMQNKPLKSGLSTGALFTFDLIASDDFAAPEGAEIVLSDLQVSAIVGAFAAEGECVNCPIIDSGAENKAAYEKVLEQINALETEYTDALAEMQAAYPDYSFDEISEIITNAIEEAKTSAKQALDSANEDETAYNFPFSGEEIEAMIAEMKAAPEKSALEAANQAAYDTVMETVNKLQEDYNAALEEAQKADPDFDFSEMSEIIENAINEAKTGAEQALASANEDGETFNFPFDGGEIEAMIEELKAAPAKAALEAANKAAYDEVVAKIDELQADYESALAEIKEANPEYDFSEWTEMIEKALDEAKTGAEQALATANEEGVEFSFPFDGSDIKNAIAEMQHAPEKSELENNNKIAYDKVITAIDELKAEYESALAESEKAYPDFDFTEMSEIITNALDEAKTGADQALAAATEDGEAFNFPFDGEEISSMIAELKKAPITSANKAAYDEVVAKIDKLQADYEAALAEAKKADPNFDFSDMSEIIENAINEAKTGAEQALDSANEDGTAYNFPFSGDEIEAMIAELQAAPAKAANQAAYDVVKAAIDAVQNKYETALEEAQKENPDYDFTEWSEIIEKAINEAQEGAEQALANANEEGTEFSYAFEGTDIENMIAEMQAAPGKSALENANQLAYEKVIASVDEVETTYENTLADAQKAYPEFDFSEWTEMIEKAINEAKTGAKQALDTANEEGEEFNYAFEGTDIEDMIAEMKAAPAKAALEAANQAAYDEVVAAIEKVQNDYDTALEEAQKANPEFDFSEWSEFIEKAINEAKTGAEQALANANEDGEAFNFPFSTEEIENMIKEMQAAPEKADLEAANKAAYDAVMDTVNDLQEKYDAALEEAQKANPDYDFSEWTEMIEKAINEAKTGAEQALAAATEDGETFNFPFDGGEIENMIAEMKAAPEKSELEAANKAAYDEVVAAIEKVQNDYDTAFAEAQKAYPDYDFSEWTEMIENALDEAKTGAEQALATATEEGVEFSFPFDGSDLEAMIAEMQAAPEKSELENANQIAYDKVIAAVDELKAEYESALAESEKAYPDFDFSEMSEIIEKALDDAKTGAEQALASANEDGEAFNFPFDGEEISSMIAELKSAPLKDANQAAYDEVVASIDKLQADYEAALEEAKKADPNFDFSDMSEIIENAINEAKTGAEQAFAAATEDGVEFSYPFSGEEIENMIEELKAAPAKAANQAAYDEVMAEIEKAQADYETALAEVKKDNPDFDTTSWSEIIENAINEAKEGAEQALANANEDGEKFNFPFSGEEIANMIAQMKADAKTSAISIIEAEVAAGNAKIFTLDGKQHNAPVRGKVNVIVRATSTSKVFVK